MLIVNTLKVYSWNVDSWESYVEGLVDDMNYRYVTLLGIQTIWMMDSLGPVT